MTMPYKFIKVQNGIIFFFIQKEVVFNQPCTVTTINNEQCIAIADYAMPINCMDINEKTETYTIYLAGSMPQELEAVIIGTMALDQKAIGKILILKELLPAT